MRWMGYTTLTIRLPSLQVPKARATKQVMDPLPDNLGIRYQYPQDPKTPVIKQVMDRHTPNTQHCGEVAFSSLVQVAIQNRKTIYAQDTHYISCSVSCFHIVCYSMLLDLQHLWLTVVLLATCRLDTTTGGIYIRQLRPQPRQPCYQNTIAQIVLRDHVKLACQVAVSRVMVTQASA